MRETAFRSCAFCVAVRELLGHYMALEEFYMNETVTMAVRIDELVCAPSVLGGGGGGHIGVLSS